MGTNGDHVLGITPDQCYGVLSCFMLRINNNDERKKDNKIDKIKGEKNTSCACEADRRMSQVSQLSLFTNARAVSLHELCSHPDPCSVLAKY